MNIQTLSNQLTNPTHLNDSLNFTSIHVWTVLIVNMIKLIK